MLRLMSRQQGAQRTSNKISQAVNLKTYKNQE